MPCIEHGSEKSHRYLDQIQSRSILEDRLYINLKPILNNMLGNILHILINGVSLSIAQTEIEDILASGPKFEHRKLRYCYINTTSCTVVEYLLTKIACSYNTHCLDFLTNFPLFQVHDPLSLYFRHHIYIFHCIIIPLAKTLNSERFYY